MIDKHSHVTRTFSTFFFFSKGLITGPALKVFSPRQVAIVGSLLSGAGLILSSMSNQLWQLTITYGLLVGMLTTEMLKKKFNGSECVIVFFLCRSRIGIHKSIVVYCS